MWHIYSKNPVTGETPRVRKGIDSFLLSQLPPHLKTNRTLRSDVRLKALLRETLFIAVRGSVRK